jgi:serine phosphatase RsbU (regulator of sigma subunit)
MAPDIAMGALIVIESLLVIAACVLAWRRTRPSDPPYGVAMGWGALAILLEVALLIPAYAVLQWMYPGAEATGRLGGPAWSIWAIQMLRASLLLLALSMWLRIVKPRLVRSWRGLVLGIALLIKTLLPDVPVIGSLLIVVVLFRLKWTGAVYGWRRLLGFLATLILLVLTMANVDRQIVAGQAVEASFRVSDSPSVEMMGSDIPEPAASIARLTMPWDTVVRVGGSLLRWQLLIACLQFLVFPIRLRGLSLKRRFTVTMILYRVIPGLLGFAAVVLGVYFGMGLHKARMAQEAFVHTLDGNLRAAGVVLDATAGWPRSVGDDAVLRQFGEAARWMTDEDTKAYYVLKQVRLRYVDADSAGGTRAKVDTVLQAVSTPGTPSRFLTTALFGAGAVDTVTGMTVADTVLYLGAGAAARHDHEAVVAEAYTAVDAAYLAGIAKLIQADVRFRAIPDMFIGETSLTVASDTVWTDSSFTVSATAGPPPDRGGFWHENHFLARSFIPLSDWRVPISQSVSGAADLRLDVSPNRLFGGIFANMLVFSSNAVALVIFASILLLFLVAEYSAARTGRSIIRGILDDVKGLAEAAGRFGEGDLSHRIEVRGKDELGSLSASFNTMAENIEQNQELLLEKERLEADLSLARDIQQRMLPQSPPVLPGLDVAGISIPSREVGGDLFYFLPVPEGRLGLTIGDVSGKSVPAALLMSNVLAALKTEARLIEGEGEILSHLNRLIAEQVEPGRFVTFFYGVVDRLNRTLSYASAGHNPALKVGTDGTAEWLAEAGMPLGVLPENTYTPARVALEVGDVLVLYSDGVTEAERHRGTEVLADDPGEPEFYDDYRLERAVRSARRKSASEIVRAVVDSVREFTGGADLSDDLTLVVVKIVEND